MIKNDRLEFAVVIAEIQTFLESMFDAIVTEDVWKDLWNVQANRWVKTNV